MTASACLLVALAGLAVAQSDIFVDDWFNKDQIQYLPADAWRAAQISDRYALTSTYTNVTGASVTFNFTGIGIQYMGYADHSNPNTTDYLTATLDDQTVPIPGNLGIDHPNQQILFIKQDLPYGLHTITIKKVAGPLEGADINVDAFIYRIPDNSPTVTKGVQPTATPESTGVSPGVIAGGVVGGVAAGGIIAFLVWYILRKRRAAKVGALPAGAVEQHYFNPYAPHPNAASRPDMASIHTGIIDPAHGMPGYGSYSTVPTPYVVSNGGPSTYHSHTQSASSKVRLVNGVPGSSHMPLLPQPQSPESSSGQGSVFHQPSFSTSSHGQTGSLEPVVAQAMPPLRQLPVVPPVPLEGPSRMMSPQPPPPYAPS